MELSRPRKPNDEVLHELSKNTRFSSSEAEVASYSCSCLKKYQREGVGVGAGVAHVSFWGANPTTGNFLHFLQANEREFCFIHGQFFKGVAPNVPGRGELAGSNSKVRTLKEMPFFISMISIIVQVNLEPTKSLIFEFLLSL